MKKTRLFRCLTASAVLVSGMASYMQSSAMAGIKNYNTIALTSTANNLNQMCWMTSDNNLQNHFSIKLDN